MHAHMHDVHACVHMIAVGRLTFLGSLIPIHPSELILLLAVKVLSLHTALETLLSVVIKLGNT